MLATGVAESDALRWVSFSFFGRAETGLEEALARGLDGRERVDSWTARMVESLRPEAGRIGSINGQKE